LSRLARLLAAVAALATTGRARGGEPWQVTPLPGPLPPPAAEGTVDVPGARLHWAAWGSGAPVLLLHGGAGNGEHWAWQVPALAPRFRVIALDARGHGRSTRDARPFGYHRMAEDLVAVMDALALPRASLVGWSDGGIVGLDAAIHHPDRVARLVALGPNYDLTGLRRDGGPHPTFAAYFDRCAADYRRLSATPQDFAGFVAALRKMWIAEPNLTPAQLAGIRAPTLVVDGDHDEILRQDHVRRLATLIPGARLLLIPGTSHFALWQRPDAFNAALVDFLGEPWAAEGR
jgi:pimeloyl-ACP methyl ester carboxylesterase